MKQLSALAALAGFVALTALVAHEGYHAVVAALAAAGAGLLWIVPFRLLPLGLDAYAWRVLLAPRDAARRAPWPYLLWVACIREATNRLLPVANIGGEILGIRLVNGRGVPGPAAAASVILEVLLTTVNQVLFAAMGLGLLLACTQRTAVVNALLGGLALGVVMAVALALVLRHGQVFARLARLAASLLGDSVRLAELAGHSASLDAEVLAGVNRGRRLACALAWQLGGMLLGSFETWFVLRLLGHPVSATVALTLESLVSAVRNFAFFVPAGLGVQEAGLVLFGHLVGVEPQMALALSVARRMRELLLGVPALVSWQWSEGMRLRNAAQAGAGTSMQNRSA